MQPWLKSTLYQIYLLLKGLCITFLKKTFLLPFLLPRQLGRRARPASPTKKSSVPSPEYHTWEGLHGSPGHLHCMEEAQKENWQTGLLPGLELDTDLSSTQPARFGFGFSISSVIWRPGPALHTIPTLPAFPHPLLSSAAKCYPKFSIYSALSSERKRYRENLNKQINNSC